MNTGVNYTMFYDILLSLREYFHSYGRIDDSNAKLDEIIKLISISYSLAKEGKRLDLSYVRSASNSNFGNSNEIAKSLRIIFESEIKKPLFQNSDGTNIFGTKPTLAIQDTENDFAEKIISEIEKIDFVYLIEESKYSEFDIINECFGHFVRENFRNNKEDAQYMTPYEISRPVLDIIFEDMKKNSYLDLNTLKHFKVMDPTCGVGTLLIEASNHFTRFVKDNVKVSEEQSSIINTFRSNGIIGQDKVERMVRLSKVNALLLGSNPSNIDIGNSIIGKSKIDDYKGEINLIFTNPPFGAEFNEKELDLSNYPILAACHLVKKSISSELLLLDKCLAYLKEDGYLAIVLPDSVFTSKGLNSLFRDSIIKNTRIVGTIGLPSVTFAQAGTRTNTCILILQKKKSENSMFMADCKDLGYVVKEKAGVPVKIEQGQNEMSLIASSLTSIKNTRILSEKPSVTLINKNELLGNILKPSFYAVERFKTIEGLKENTPVGFEVEPLKNVVEFTTKLKKSYLVSNEIRHISVLHINANCTIDFSEVEKYEPICKGRECDEGEIIISKLNPRIPRMSVVPTYDKKLVCSNEFEIMKCKGIIGPYVLCFLLKSENVSKQIENLTSGTSSSHSRIKREQLADILIPVPKTDSAIAKMQELDALLAKNIEAIYEAELGIRDCVNVLNSL